MKKLVLFGDSLLAGCGKHRILMLEEKLGGEFDVYNFAAGGWDVTDLEKKAEFVAKLKPELILLSVGTNDASPWKQVKMTNFVENLRKVLTIFSESKVIYFLPTPIDEVKHQPLKMRSNVIQQQYYEAAKGVCKEFGVDYIKSWELFLPMLDSGQEYLVEDGVHLRDNAYEIIFSEVARIVR